MGANTRSSICVIITTYNRALLLRECIDSVLSINYPIEQIIVVSDGSTDDTDVVAKAYGERITFITKKNGGKPSALNVGLAQCKADYIWICDDDDLAVPDGLEHLAAALDTDESLGFAYGQYKVFWDDAAGRIYSDPPYKARSNEPNVKINFLEGMFTHQCTMLVRRSLYAEVGPFREDLIRSQDYDMAIRLSRNAKIAYVPRLIYLYREHSAPRGSIWDGFPFAMREEKWFTYDQKILSVVCKEYKLEEFTPTFALQWDNTLSRRAALIELASILARRSIWDGAINDFCEAGKISSAPISPQEIQLLDMAVQSLAAWEMLYNNHDLIAGLRSCNQQSQSSHDMIHALCRPLIWHSYKTFKNGDIRGAIKGIRILIRISGIRGACLRIASSLIN